MADQPQYKRVLLKLSGEALCEAEGFGIESAAMDAALQEIVPVAELGVQLALVVGAGNFLRGRSLAAGSHVRRITADHMGMLATVVNALALQDALGTRGLEARVMSAIPMPTVCEGFNARAAVRHLQRGRVVLFAGGTGCPFLTTDTAAALRASEIGAELIVKATKVEGVYDSDPMINPAAKRYERLTYQKVLADELGVMDLAAVSLCSDNRIPIVVCQLFEPGSLVRAVRGEEVGTLITE